MYTAAMKSFIAKPNSVGGQWHLVDASGKVLGRLAAELATVLMGKHKPTYTPHVLTGDFVVVVNVEKIKLTGRKLEQEAHDYYTYYPGGHKIIPIAKLMKTHPDRVLRRAVGRMLPKNKLGRAMLTRLKIYRGAEHPHVAQQPKPLEFAKV
jgi:large subunit ribosomal protein L13